MSKKRLLIAVILSLIFFCSTAAIWLYFKTKERIAALQTPAAQQTAVQNEVSSAMKQLKTHLLVPEEEPVIATIIDPALVATKSAFYSQVQKDDQLIIFPEAKKAVLFRPRSNIIVNMGPLQFEEVSTQSSQPRLKP
jgi:hypothetical protein